MCGIIGYVGRGPRQIKDTLLDSLKRLEYRGYDSAGVAVLEKTNLLVEKAKGKLQVLATKLNGRQYTGRLGIGHTRWATHGAPSDKNSHPHESWNRELAIVHNGIIENYAGLKDELKAAGYKFRSDTDSEVIATLIQHEYQGDLPKAVRGCLNRLEGNFAVCVMHRAHPDMLVAARRCSPLILGIGKNENFVASDVPAILPYTREVIYLDDDDMAVLTADGIAITDARGKAVPVKPHIIDWTIESAQKEGFEHFMLKEIFEQPRALAAALAGNIPAEGTAIRIPEIELSDSYVKKINRVVCVACGTAWHAGLVGKYMMEEYAGIPCEAVMASEFRYGNPILDKHSLVIAITQSGETADTLAGVRKAREQGAKVITVCNVVGSTIAREADGALYMRCGPEIGVASTKAYTAMLASLSLLALHLGRRRGMLEDKTLRGLLDELQQAPAMAERVLQRAPQVKQLAETFARYKDFMYIGRRYNYPTACEAALKLKEISYFHAEGYAGGEMKHGPIALIDEHFPTVAIVPEGVTYPKMVSNLQEIKARGGLIIAIASEGDKNIRSFVDHVIEVPRCSELISPILTVIPLQLFAYYIATLNGRDVDQPRNLAKSVTVE